MLPVQQGKSTSVLFGLFSTITLLLNEISSQAGVNYGLMAASVVLVVLPVLLVYVLLQKNIIQGLTVGAIKG